MVASKNGSKAQQADGPPLRFSYHGDEVQLGEQAYHLAVHTTAGARELQEFINAANLPVFGAESTDTPGRAIVLSALTLGRWELIDGLVKRAVFEDLPAGMSLAASPDQLVGIVDALLNQSGLDWLRRILKNSIAALTEEVNQATDGLIRRQQAAIGEALQRVGENVSTGTESPSPASTASS